MTVQKAFHIPTSKLEKIFGDVALEIEHIGASAVEGLSSKPLIDIAVMIDTYKDADDFTEEWKGMPLARQVQPEDICRAVRFILKSPAVTGQMIAVDAGQHMGMR